MSTRPTGPVSAARERERLLDQLLSAGCDALTAERISADVDHLEEQWPEIKGAPIGGVEEWAERHGGGERHAHGAILAPRRTATRREHSDPVDEARYALPWPRRLSPSCPRAQGFVRRWDQRNPPPPGILQAFIEQHPYDCPRCWRYARSWRRRFNLWLAGIVLVAIITTAPL
jgi:hypothetical protein